MAAPEVLFVSKPIVEPFRDGSKCLVRDLCEGFGETHAHVMGVHGQPAQLSATCHAVYSKDGGFAPGLRQNAEALAFLLRRSPTSLWHTVFAPNLRSSQALAFAKGIRRARCLQTVASAPRSFRHPEKLLFGERIVTLSEWTKRRFETAFRDAGLPCPPITHLPPPAPEVSVSEDERSEARKRRGFRADPRQGPPLFLYPGDLEVSGGAHFVVALAESLKQRLGRVRILIAYRDKTAAAAARALELQKVADPSVVFFERNVADLHALLAGATGVLFPVDDLFAKVDLPIVLLEAMRLGTPVLALNEGTLHDMAGAHLLPPDPREWVEAASALVEQPDFRADLVARGQQAVTRVYDRTRIAMAHEELYRELRG